MYIIIVIMIKFNPTIYVREEGIFLQYNIKGKFGEKNSNKKNIIINGK